MSAVQFCHENNSNAIIYWALCAKVVSVLSRLTFTVYCENYSLDKFRKLTETLQMAKPGCKLLCDSKAHDLNDSLRPDSAESPELQQNKLTAGL